MKDLVLGNLEIAGVVDIAGDVEFSIDVHQCEYYAWLGIGKRLALIKHLIAIDDLKPSEVFCGIGLDGPDLLEPTFDLSKPKFSIKGKS